MKKAGYIMVTFGFLTGSLVAVLDETNVQWIHFAGSLILGGIGIFLVHLGEHKDKRSEEKITANLQDVEDSLRRIVENMARLNGQKQSINPFDIRHRVDELFADDLTTFVQARESLAHAHGLHFYADVMSHFASGERYLNRVWSASADGYVDEIADYLDKAQTQFAQALDMVGLLRK